MLYIAIFAISLFTVSNAVVACPTGVDACTPNNCGLNDNKACYRDSDINSNTYGCDTCQSYDQCANYPVANRCVYDSDCGTLNGVARECKTDRFVSGSSTIVCSYCADKVTTTSPDPTEARCVYNSDCGDIKYRCYGASSSQEGTCMEKCPLEDCVDSNVAGGIATCVTDANTYGVCRTDPNSQYSCRKCEDPTTTTTTTTKNPDTTSTTQCTGPTYTTVSVSQNGGLGCGLKLCDGTIIPEGQITDNYKAQMIEACPELAYCWNSYISMNSCQCPYCEDRTSSTTTKAPDTTTTRTACANVNGYPCDTTDDCIEVKGDTWGCAYTSADGCMTCQNYCDGQCIDDTDCRTYTQTGGATYTRQGSCVRDGGSNYGCKTCKYDGTTTKPTTTTTTEGELCECTPDAYDDSCKSWQYCDGTTASGASSNTCGVCVDYCPDLSLNPAGIPSSCYIEAGNDQCNNNALNIIYYCVDDGNDDLCGICSTTTDKPSTTTTTTSGSECCSYREYISFFDSNGFPGADGGYGCCPGGYWVTLNDALDPNDANSGKMDCNGEYYEPRTGDNYFCPCECYISMTSSGNTVGTGCDADEECMPFDDDWKWSNVAADNYRRCGYCDGGVDESSTEEPVFCTDDARKCPDGSYVSRDPDNNCEFEPCPCCLKEDLEAVKENAIGIPFGGYTCCPDGTIGQGNDVIIDPNIGQTMFCDNYDEQLPIRPINNYLCSNTTTEEPVFCTADAKICPDGSAVGRDPDNNCEFYPCPCCLEKDYDTKLRALSNDVAGSTVSSDLGCFPDGTVAQVFIGYSDTNEEIKRMSCDGVSYYVRPQEDYTCPSNATTTTTTTTEANCCKVDDDGNTEGCLSGQTCVDFYDGCGYCDGGSSGNMIEFMVAIAFTLGLFAWMH